MPTKNSTTLLVINTPEYKNNLDATKKKNRRQDMGELVFFMFFFTTLARSFLLPLARVAVRLLRTMRHHTLRPLLAHPLPHGIIYTQYSSAIFEMIHIACCYNTAATRKEDNAWKLEACIELPFNARRLLLPNKRSRKTQNRVKIAARSV